MKSRLLFIFVTILLFGLLTAISYGGVTSPPVDNHGKLTIELVLSEFNWGKSDYWVNTTANIPEEYIKRFGAFPAFMLWEDVPDTVRILFEIKFERKYHDYSEYNPPAPEYPLDMTWSDAREFLYWRLVNTKDGSTSFEPLKMGDGKKTIVSQYYSNSWYNRLDFDAKRLPVPNDGSAYELTLEMFENEPVSASEKPIAASEPFNVVRTTRTTELDTLQWASYKNIFSSNIPLTRRLNSYFSNDILLIRSLLIHYRDQQQLDSLEYYCREYIRVRKERSDPHHIRYPMTGDTLSLPRPITNNDYDFIQRIYQEVSGDTLDLGPRVIPPYEEEYGKMIIQ